MAVDYGGILGGIIASLKADSDITDLLAARTIAGVANKANNVFSGAMPDSPSFPCIALRDLSLQATQGMHENPWSVVTMVLEISIFGDSSSIRPILGRVDARLEAINRGVFALSDTSEWAFKDVDTSGDWLTIPYPREVKKEGSGQHTEQRVKVFSVLAANKGI